MEINDFDKDTTFGVIGVCGINGNLIARVLSDHGYNVIANDLVNKEDCKYSKALVDYPEIKIYYGEIPDEFYEISDYIILPTALIESKSGLYQKIVDMNIPILTVEDILELFEPTHPVICITGTNGKTTTTTLLKHIAYNCGLKPCEHNLEGMQGNIADIPPLQSRLNCDVSILETGTFGQKGSLRKVVKSCKPDAAIITNITPDHLTEGSSFLDYAQVKAEIIDLVQGKTLIINSDDPTVKKFVEVENYNGNLITFGLDTKTVGRSTKPCICGSDVKLKDIIEGSGIYECICGLKYSKPDYIATNINDSHNKFTLQTPDGEYDFELSISGIHNIYNATAAIVTAHVILGLSYDSIARAVKSFTGVAGRMEILGEYEDKMVMVDYAHNPAGVTTLLRELKNSYDSVINVITTSSESGMEGDDIIFSCALSHADYVIPASHNSYTCAKNHRQKKTENHEKIVLPDKMPKGDKSGTLGATQQQVLVGFRTALTLDGDLIVCTGEAAFKYKTILKDVKQ